MRPLDLLHSCSLGTHKVYQQKLQILRRFEGSLGVSVLRTKPLARPPSGPNITVMWAQEHYSLRSRGECKGQLHDATLAFATIRQLRSAASQFYTVDVLMANPGQLYMDSNNHLSRQAGRVTDEHDATMFGTGLSSRIGNQPRPSIALLERHVKWLDNDLDKCYRSATSPALCRELSMAGLANTSFLAQLDPLRRELRSLFQACHGYRAW